VVIQVATKFQNKTAEHQPLRLDSKTRAWGLWTVVIFLKA